MFSCVEFLNKKRLFKFDYNKLIELNNWCAKTYFEGCAQLYNLGRLTIPSAFDIYGTLDIISTLSDDEYAAIINNTTSEVCLDYELIDCLLALNKLEDKTSFKYLSQVLYAAEVNNILRNLCNTGIEWCKTGVIKTTINIKLADKLRINNGENYFNLDILNCLLCEDGKTFAANYDLRGIYLETLADFIGIDKETYKRDYVDKNKSLLFENATYDLDKKLLRFYLKGHLFGDNSNAEKFKKLFFEFYKDNYSDSIEKSLGMLTNKIYKDSESAINEYIGSLRTSLKVKDIYIEDRAITPEFWSCWVSDNTEGDYTELPRLDNDFRIGLYFYNHTSKKFDNDVSLRLQGFSGEYIYYKDRRSYKLKGLPVVINGNLYYPVYNAENYGNTCKCFEKKEVHGDTFTLDSRAIEIYNLLINIDADRYSFESLQDNFNRINTWLKKLTLSERDDIFTKIISVYTNASISV